ncbi:MAG: NifU family protein [Kiritimatiellae bacterium]|nr:NifU family protein [Kiritimatiellia bacterium]
MSQSNTVPAPEPSTSFEERVRRLIEDHVNPALASHGGFARLVGVENHDVLLELGGGCRGCPGARMTVHRGIEAFLREQIPEVGRVIDVTDHGR